MNRNTTEERELTALALPIRVRERMPVERRGLSIAYDVRASPIGVERTEYSRGSGINSIENVLGRGVPKVQAVPVQV